MIALNTLLTSRFHLTADLHPGYRLVRLRGRGGFGEVWEGETLQGERVALKFLPCQGQAAPLEVRSIQMVKQLNHPNLTRIEKVWCAPGFLVIVMELADGSLADLHEVYRGELGGPMPPDHICPLLAQVAEGLDFLNRRQHFLQGQWVTIQHCDVTPPNLLVFGETVKVSDFGLTTPLGFREKTHDRAGTPAYAAPEVFLGRVSDSTDQYNLAMCYCVLRGGRSPFPDLPLDFLGGYVRPAPDLRMLGEAEQPIVARALALAPQDRWPSCVEFMAQLTRATAVTPPPSGVRERRKEPRHQAQSGITCQVLPTQGNGAWSAVVQNISAGGARLRIAQPGCPLHPGRILEVVLQNAARGVRVLVPLRLSHSKEQPDGDWEVGGPFEMTLPSREVEALSVGVCV
jgi:serine/threonine protein kinase